MSGSTAATRSRPGSPPPASSRAGGHHAHALHSPYWWMNCAFGRESLPSRTWHKLLVWDIIKAPTLTRTAEKLLNPVMGKSLVVYADKPASPGSASAAA